MKKTGILMLASLAVFLCSSLMPYPKDVTMLTVKEVAEVSGLVVFFVTACRFFWRLDKMSASNKKDMFS